MMEPTNEATQAPAGSVPWARVVFAPPDPWVEIEDYDASLKAKEGIHLTHLLWSRQELAGVGRSFNATALRLETPLAVQHQSQWSLDLDPRTQHLIFHWLRVKRGDQVIDHLHRDRMRLIQRETQLEHLVLDGRWTLLVVLDDVRPGDVVEAGYTYETQHPIRPDSCEVYFAVPSRSVVGKYRLSVLFEPSRPHMAWLASPDAPERREDTLPDGTRRWTWTGSQRVAREPEANQPSDFLDYIWVQVSDLPDWNDLAVHVAATWDKATDETDLASFPGFARPAEINETAITQLVEYIQDNYRYLSIDLETGGWVPAAPGLVARRRYGDCKDLAWLATNVLRGWGVTARPILVGTGLRARVAKLLPMSNLFNHAILEVELAGRARWFDLTIQSQGGTFWDRTVGWYSHGLPVAAGPDGLLAQPGLRAYGLYALRETILLDTRRGEPSLVEQRLWVSGWQADGLRRTRHNQGAEEFALERERSAQRRYGKAGRLGTLQWRDDRVNNVCELAESFKFTDQIYSGEDGQRAHYDVPIHTVVQWFGLPDDNKPRRGPWDLAYGLEVRHQITVRNSAMGAGARNRRRWMEAEFSATLDEPRDAGEWTKTARLTFNVDEVPPDEVQIFRTALDKFQQATGWRLYMPWGRAAPTAGAGFGSLPAPNLGIAAYVAPVDPRDFPDAATVTGGSTVAVSPKKKWYQYQPTTATRFGSPFFWVAGLMAISAIARNCERDPYVSSTVPVRAARIESRPLPNFEGITVANLKDWAEPTSQPLPTEPGKQTVPRAQVQVQSESVRKALNPYNLKLGMTKTQVSAVMGPPAETATIVATSYTMELWTYPNAGYDPSGRATNRVLLFRNDQLTGWNDRPADQNRPQP
jgi:transglutaminase-like putative cysteine protease